MGKTRTFPYRLEILGHKLRWTPQEWRIRSDKLRGPGFGKPSPGNIAKWVEQMEKSMLPGGCNAHASDTILFAQVVDQRTDKVVASWCR